MSKPDRPAYPREFPTSNNGALITRHYFTVINPTSPERPKNLDQLAALLAEVLPRSKRPVTLLRLMHRKEIVTLLEIEQEVYDDYDVADVMYVIKKARGFIEEYELPFRLEVRDYNKLVRVDISE